MRKILHLHGIGSAGGGATASVLKKLFSDIEVISPDIPVRPLEAFAFISRLVAGNEFDFVVGTSLGGFYAMLIKGIPKFLINPAMNAPTDIENAIGLGKHDFLRPRQDGAISYTIDRSFIDELEILLKGYNSSSYDFSKETFGIFGRNDELLHNADMFREKFDEKNMLTADFGHRLPVRVLKQVVYPFMIQKLSGTQLTK